MMPFRDESIDGQYRLIGEDDEIGVFDDWIILSATREKKEKIPSTCEQTLFRAGARS